MAETITMPPLDMKKIETTKIILGNNLPPALHYINIADIREARPAPEGQTEPKPCHTRSLAIDCVNEVGKIAMYINPLWLEKINTEDLRRIFTIEAARIALHHVTSRSSKNESNLPSSDTITKRFTVGQTYVTKTNFDKSYKESGIEEKYNAAKMLYEKETGNKWDVKQETHEKLAYWMHKALPKMQAPANMSGLGAGAAGAGGQGNNNSNGNGGAGGGSQDAVDEYMKDQTRDSGWGPNDAVKETITEATKHLEGSGALGSSTWGTGEGNLMDKIVAASKPPVDPQRIIKSFIRNIMMSDTAPLRTKLNRRYGYRVPGKHHLFTTKILVAVDTSGSMSDKDVADGCALIQHLARNDAIIDFSWWDCGCTVPVDMKKRQSRSKNGMEITGRGGTDPECIWHMLEKEGLSREYSGIVVFSDMYFGEVKPPKSFNKNKIVWIATKDGTKPPEWVRANRYMKTGDWRKSLAKHRGQTFND